MHARHVTVRGNPAHVDEVVRTQQEVVVPVLRGCTGFVAQLVLLDRAKGEAIGISLWDSEENMQASEEKVRSARQRVADALQSADPPKVQLYEVAIFEQG
jgi:hypoxanthine-guanine phosphoribosyltransferase